MRTFLLFCILVALVVIICNLYAVSLLVVGKWILGAFLAPVLVWLLIGGSIYAKDYLRVRLFGNKRKSR